MITAKILKKSWTVEAAKALLNSVPLFMCPTDTIVFVTVVPIFAPIIIGIEPAIVRLPLLTIPTINDVVVDINIISPSLNSSSVELVQLIKKNKKTWNGVLLIYPFKPDIIKALKANFPCVSLVEQFGGQNIDCVDVDHNRGISTIIDKLINKGHKRIGFLTRSYAVQACWSYRRYSAFADQLIRRSIAIDESDIINIYPDRLLSPKESIKEAIEVLK